MNHPVYKIILLLAIVAGYSYSSGFESIAYAASAEADMEASPSDSHAEKFDDPDYYDFSDDDDDYASVPKVPDPLYVWNKAMFHFNDRFYFWIFKPVAVAYREITPTPVRIGLKNFFENLKTPVRFVNCILQGKFEPAGTELARFIVNSSAGVAGFMDAASQIPELKNAADEDLGQTLAVYGLGDGLYIIWPILGPSSLRDSARIIGDGFLDPLQYVDPAELSVGLNVLDQINSRSFYIGDYESLIKAAIDPYSAVKNAYFQFRKAKIQE